MMKSRDMSLSRVLQLSALLVGLCQAHKAPQTGDGFTSQKPGKVPESHLRMLALGLAHLLQGLEENVQQLEQQGELVGAELDGATRNLENLRKQSLQTGRTHRQVRKDLQIQSARGDRLWRAVRDLQKELEDLETEQGAVQHQMNRIIQSVKSLKESRSGSRTQPDTSSVKVLIDKQARQLASLTTEVSARERIINRRLRLIEQLEKRLSSGPPSRAEVRSLP
ncbi:uncharacterized protein [Leuresthes tenuis]|uniref:uncharacterized protein n=1 Tax=Leuresthes tenuis TaxID=355514 RepID=UPI003B5131FE